MSASFASRKPLLVVRPLRQQDAFLQLLQQAAIDYEYQPIMAIEPIVETEPEAQLIENAILGFAEFDYAIFISANAAELGITWLDKYWPMLPAQQAVFAVGQHTESILRAYGFSPSAPSKQQNTEGLLQEIPALQDLHNKSVIIFRGGGGRTTLADTLKRRGAAVTYCELYRRVVQADRLKAAQKLLPQCSCLVAHSGELIQAMGPAHTETQIIPLVVPSERVAEISRNLGYSKILVADNALPDAMFAKVKMALKESVI